MHHSVFQGPRDDLGIRMLVRAETGSGLDDILVVHRAIADIPGRAQRAGTYAAGGMLARPFPYPWNVLERPESHKEYARDGR